MWAKTNVKRGMWVSLLLGGVVACGSGDGPTNPGDPSGTGSGGAATGTGSGATSASGASGGASNGSGGGQTFNGYAQVDGSASAKPGSAELAAAPDGTIYVSWVDQADDVLVARSTDGGASFEAAIKLDDASTVPLVTKGRHPYVVADDARVAVAFVDVTGPVHLYVSAAGPNLSFGQPTIVGGDVNTTFRDYAKPIFLSDGSLAVSWHGYPATGARIYMSREANGFASAPASSGAPGLPCECCSLELARTDDGDVMLAFRNNDANTREMWLAKAPPSGVFGTWTAASSTEGTVNTCPMEGPRLVQLSDTSHAMVWSTRGSNNTGAAVISFSSDDGATWSGGAPIAGLMGDEPTIAIGATGRVFVTAVTGLNSATMTWSEDGGNNWSAPENVVAPDGDLAFPQADSNAGIAALAGVSTSGNVWLLRME